MNQEDILYTKDHEWIRFMEGSSAVGVSRFKLTGILEIEDIRLFGFQNGDLIEKGLPVLHLFYKDYMITVHAPVNGKLVEMNSLITNGSWGQIIREPEGLGWLFKLAPTDTNDRNHLIIKEVYRKHF